MIRVLVVDDDQSIRDVLVNVLRLEGYDAITAEGGMEAISAIENDHPDVVLLDLMMPDMDGFQVLSEMHEVGLTVPVITFSAMMGMQESGYARLLGARMSLQKPFAIAELISSISTVVNSAVVRQD